MGNKKISLDANDFKTLVSGGVVKQDGVKIILKDIYHFLSIAPYKL